MLLLALRDPLRQRESVSRLPPPSLTTTPQRPAPTHGRPSGIPAPPLAVPNGALLSPVPQPMPPSRKQWYDRFADALLGEDDSQQPHSRYALICQKCFAHNGLVRESEWETTKYVCPKCGFLNQSARARAKGQRPSQPPSAATLSAGHPRSSLSPTLGGRARLPSEDKEEEVAEGDSMQMDIDQ